MTPSYDRNVIVNGKALGTASYFHITQVRLDSAPQKDITTTKLAERDGEYLLGQKFINKMVIVSGYFLAPERWDYEKGRDELLYLLNRYQEVSLNVEQSAEERIFKGVYENIRFEYKERGLVMVEIEFRIISVFGESVEKSYPVQDKLFTDTLDASFEVKGSAPTQPIIKIDIHKIKPLNKPIMISLVSNSNGKRNRIDIQRIWNEGDTLIIDSTKKEVKVNGAYHLYNGVFPEFFGETNVSIFDDGSSRTMNANIEYSRRWL